MNEQSSLSLTRQVDQVLDKEIDIYEEMINQFELSTETLSKGNLLNECNKQFSKIQAMINEQTLYSRRKKINTLKQRFEKLQLAFIQKFDFEQLLDYAKRLKCFLPQFRQQDYANIEQGLQLRQKMFKLIEQYEFNQTDPKCKKIIMDAQQIINEANYYLDNPPATTSIVISQVFDQKKLQLIGSSEKADLGESQKAEEQVVVEQPKKNSNVVNEQNVLYRNSIDSLHKEQKRSVSYEQTPLYYRKSPSVMVCQQQQKRGFFSSVKNVVKKIFSPCTQEVYEDELLQSNMQRRK